VAGGFRLRSQVHRGLHQPACCGVLMWLTGGTFGRSAVKICSGELSRYTTWRRLGRPEVQLLLILYLGTRWGEWYASRPGRALPPGKGPPSTHWMVGTVGPRAGLDAEARRKIPCPCPGSNPGSIIRSQTLPKSDWATAAHSEGKGHGSHQVTGSLKRCSACGVDQDR
jgi:hypothetical protein